MNNKLNDFVICNKDDLVEALDNHLSEINSIMESADDDEYLKLNKDRQKLLKRLLVIIKTTK